MRRPCRGNFFWKNCLQEWLHTIFDFGVNHSYCTCTCQFKILVITPWHYANVSKFALIMPGIIVKKSSYHAIFKTKFYFFSKSRSYNFSGRIKLFTSLVKIIRLNKEFWKILIGEFYYAITMVLTCVLLLFDPKFGFRT